MPIFRCDCYTQFSIVSDNLSDVSSKRPPLYYYSIMAIRHIQLHKLLKLSENKVEISLLETAVGLGVG